MVTLVIATRNAHKVEEIRAILGNRFECAALDAFPNAPDVVEDAGTFAGNATKKSVALATWLAHTHQKRRGGSSAVYVLADDSGLEVDALNGAPGVHSARFAALDAGAAGNSTSADNNAKLLRLLSHVAPAKRTARFHCVVALTPVAAPQPESASPVCCAEEAELQTELFEGTCEGHIAMEPRGQGGFGYDPLFIPSGYDQTFGELSEQVKNGLSHRARALAGVQSRLQPTARRNQ